MKRWIFAKLLEMGFRGSTIKLFLKTYLKKQSIMPENSIKNPIPKIWTMWLQDDVPELCQICIESIKKYYPDAIVITEKNIRNYINFPDYIWDKYKSGKILPCHFSDFIRVCLLDKYGGTWIDATCFLTSAIPNYILNSDFFILTNFDSSTVSNYFIHSNANHYLTKSIKNFLLDYWKNENKAYDYFFFHKYLLLFTKNNDIAKKEWEKMPISLNLNTKLMYKVLHKEFDKELFEWLSQTSYLHKLTYKNFDRDNINENSLYQHIKKDYKPSTIS